VCSESGGGKEDEGSVVWESGGGGFKSWGSSGKDVGIIVDMWEEVVDQCHLHLEFGYERK